MRRTRPDASLGGVCLDFCCFALEISPPEHFTRLEFTQSPAFSAAHYNTFPKNQVRSVCVNPTVGYKYSQNELTYPYRYVVLCQIGTKLWAVLRPIGLPTSLPSHQASRYRYQLWGTLLFMEAYLFLSTALSNRQRHRNLDKLPAEIHSFQFSRGCGE